MAGILALVGSGEFTDEVIDIDEFILSKTKNPKVAILATAAGREKAYQKWVEDGISHFKKLKTFAAGIDIKNSEDTNNPHIEKELDKFNIYYFSGGDPGYLLDTTKDSFAWKTIIKNYQNGAAIIGCSAGAMIMGKKVWARVYDYLNKGIMLPWEPGHNLAHYGIIPHFGEVKKDFIEKKLEELLKNLPKDSQVIGIEENTAYIKINNKWLIKGRGKVHIPAFDLTQKHG
ncbi:hypothetical protein A3D00_04190 [Candidatus Woesebacteria bacterium RIFCSPHIGHO2_02_FULL_38_9]|uniref:Peptidase n=1 Tax=Candidatus Woesebacteria bacterium RIFCSPHIGHO2_01_FULL_39_28 TaxID=1802496 RepID=A0A1F7YCJ5_9BACT|nr:MAG: hypothetical protein A2627_05090 [Candidatus Woesebacteria bacterium RIFCSPHIGHO2_01_FULL_39_28]OGM33764.1 MAG: hypothetical protein A3D00_04190 [Candidatus Woesebacteria bacterium RIFCSPHIGHO2_02_FULL_38_9]OGM57568.1 MAG: hypothetical protein A3A50_06205 [Candidatus Woesebacteria bacterium RIFCSPLOWO2_01_FULL_38_20]